VKRLVVEKSRFADAHAIEQQAKTNDESALLGKQLLKDRISAGAMAS